MSLIIIERRERAALIRLNHPEKLNALSAALFAALNAQLDALEQDDSVGAIIITGSGKAFAAGVDIAELHSLPDFAAAADAEITDAWARPAACRKPLIAAVNGYALGGGCELAMMCDFILAAQSAMFAQPEIKLGTLPGIGGTQRLARAVGKALAMELCLTGRMMAADEALRAGLAARVVADAQLEEEAWQAAVTIAGYSLPALRMLKEAVNAAQEMPLAAGLRHERQLFYSSFALEDRREGMAAFLEKRAPDFQHR